jgi:hypothetical protein
VDAATVVSAEGRSMNPKRGVQLVEVGFRVDWDVQDRANRYASEEEECRRLDPDEGARTGRVAKANEPPGTMCKRRHALVMTSAVKSLSSDGTPT